MYKHLTREQRYAIYLGKQKKLTNKAIARLIKEILMTLAMLTFCIDMTAQSITKTLDEDANRFCYFH